MTVQAIPLNMGCKNAASPELKLAEQYGVPLLYLQARNDSALPLRISEFGHVFRREVSSAVYGLLRMREFTQVLDETRTLFLTAALLNYDLLRQPRIEIFEGGNVAYDTEVPDAFSHNSLRRVPQDDGHILCRISQAMPEVVVFLSGCRRLYKAAGFKQSDISVQLSTR